MKINQLASYIFPVLCSLCCFGFLLFIQGCQTESSSKLPSDNSVLSKNSSQPKKATEAEKKRYRDEIAWLAGELDKKFEDGWICGRNSRVFKSGYRVIDPKIKAEFAIAYNQMINASNQNLAIDVDSYVPYSKRFEFALKWWQNSAAKQTFEKESVKKQIVWVHESMLDGSELFWRIFEKLNPGKVNSIAVMAHDKEQDMVYNYMEKEGQPSSFSQLYAEWSKILEKDV